MNIENGTYNVYVHNWFGGGPENVLVRGTKMVNVTTPLVNKCGKQTLIMD